MTFLVLAVGIALVGCSYSPSLDDCQVRACQSASDCPTNFSCDREGYCRASGAVGSCSAVLRDGNAGFDDASSTVRDARWHFDADDGIDHTCIGTARTCSQLTSASTCGAQIGCSYSTPTCSVTTDCGQYLGGSPCSIHDECTYDFDNARCVEFPGYCAGAPQAECDGDPACEFAGGCRGTPSACGTFGAAAGCESQAGCTWN